MNANLLNAIKKFAASPAALFDPRSADENLPVFAGKEPAAERKAFIQCLASGLPGELQKCPDQRARSGCKSRAAQKMAARGVTAPLAKEIVDLVDSLVPTLPNSQPAAPVQNAGTAGGSINSLSVKTLVFGAAGGLGAVAGELISEPVYVISDQFPASFTAGLLITAIWAALISLGISIGLLVAQNINLKKPSRSESFAKTMILGILSGAFAGAVAQVIFAFTQDISTAAEIISRVICWGLMAGGVGFGVSLFIPNYPRNQAILAGFLGGVIGGAIFRATFGFLPDVAGRFFGTAVLGLCIGLAISIAEEILREAWITVVWARNETTNVSLGAKPLVLGSSPEADIYLRRDKFPPVAAIIKIENARVVVDNKLTGQCTEQADGSAVNLGTMKIIVHSKT
jgi:hypothetical protein